MNHIYRVIWSDAAATYIAVAESAASHGKRSLGKRVRATRALAVAAGLLAGAQALAGPTGGQISAGQGSIAQSGATTTISQGTQKLAIDWQRFNIGAHETVNFVQPNSSAIALNRVLGTDGSRILGQLNANGQVFILNPNGVLFGASAQVNVGGLVASTLGMSNADFLAGNHVFTNTPGSSGSVVNEGRLTAADGGYIALIAPQVRNEGVISATLGTALLAAGDKVTLNLNNGNLLGYSIDQGALDALAENKQLIQGHGGQVFLSAKAADTLATAVVNNTGVIEARTLQNKAGRILLMGDMDVGQVNVDGRLDASAPDGGNGGFIETSAAHVRIADGARITTAAPQGAAGTWLIDPLDFTITAGTAAQTISGIGASTLSSALGSGNVSIATSATTTGNGDIFVNGAVSWSANKLTLTAHRNININTDLNASGTASLALEFGQGAVAAGNTSNVITMGAKVNLPAGTTNFTTKQGSNGVVKAYTVITALGAQGGTTGTDLQGISGGLAANYALGADIDAAGTATWNSGAGFAPIGTFTGTFDGLGHSISNLKINRPGTDNVGLFGSTNGARVQNLSLVNAQVTGRDNVGALFGATVVGTAVRTHVSGQVSGRNRVGGVFGYNNTTTLFYSHATSDVTGASSVGGLMGETNGGITTAFNYASGTVTGSGNSVGGLVGYNGFAFVVADSYATGSVSGSSDVGGLVGYHLNGGIFRSYSTGSVTGTTNVGGLLGRNGTGTVDRSFWDSQTSGRATSAAGTALTTAQMRQQSNFSLWDFASAWILYDGLTNPLLRTFMTPLTVTANNAAKIYDGLAYSGGNGVTYSSAPNGNLLGRVTYSGTSQGAINAGTYVITPGGLYSNQQGYAISYANGALQVTHADQTIAALGGSTLAAAYNAAQQSISPSNGGTGQSDAKDKPITAGQLDSGDAGTPGGNLVTAVTQSSNLVTTVTQSSNLVTTVNCGVRMPQGFAVDTCQ